MPAATPRASPATGLAKRHAAEQAALIAEALGHSSSAPSAAQSPRNKGRPWPPKSKSPTLGESITEGTLGAVAEEARRSGRGRRADRQPGDRQGQRRGALAGRRRDDRAAGPGRRQCRGRRGHRADRRAAATAAPGSRRLRRRMPRPTLPAPAKLPRFAETSMLRSLSREGGTTIRSTDPFARGAPRGARISCRSDPDQGQRQGRPPDQGRRARRCRGAESWCRRPQAPQAKAPTLPRQLRRRRPKRPPRGSGRKSASRCRVSARRSRSA